MLKEKEVTCEYFIEFRITKDFLSIKAKEKDSNDIY